MSFRLAREFGGNVRCLECNDVLKELDRTEPTKVEVGWAQSPGLQ